MKVIRLRNHLTVVFEDGTTLTTNVCTDELHDSVLDNRENPDLVKHLLMPEYFKKKEEIDVKVKMLSDFNESKYLSVFGNSVYIKSISELTVPEDLALSLYNAEIEGNQELVDTYLNFWTLASLNPDSRARTNLFWFLKKYGMTISKSGLFVAYRNVALKKEGTEISSELADFISNQYTRVKFRLKKAPSKYYVGYIEDELFTTPSRDRLDKEIGVLEDLYIKLSNEEVSPVYTDEYSRTFTIKIGEPVVMDRALCDPIQENTCSRGLHVAGKEWLTKGYLGNISLMVLVNPADVVAVPPSDNYGKMRVCAYYPVQLIERDEFGDIVDKGIEDGFEDDFMEMISYQGEINDEDHSNYKIQIPSIPELNRKNIFLKLEEIKESIKNKNVENGDIKY